MTRRLTLFFAALLISLSVIKAAKYTMTATVVNPDAEPESYCTWHIFAASDTIRPILSNISDDNGVITATLPSAGDYRLRVIAAMCAPLTADFTVSDNTPNVNLGQLSTTLVGEQLEGVTVSAQRPLVTKEIDRIGYDVQADADASTSNLRDIIRKVPMVSVDADGTIKVNGSTDFKIYKNGRPNNSFTKNSKDIFAAIPASTIKKIEVITDPGAREDAESSGVILNIVTTSTSNMSGVAGNVGIEWNLRDNAPNANAFIMTQFGKLTMSATGGFYRFTKNSQRGRNRSETVYDETGDYAIDDMTYSTAGHGGWFSVEGSLELDTLNLFSTALNGYVGRNALDAFQETSMFSANGSPLYSYNSLSYYPKNGYTDIDFNFDYQHSTQLKGETLTASYRLSHTNQNQIRQMLYEDNENAPFDYTAINSDYDMRFYEHTFQFDWSRPFGSKHRLDTGAKYILRESDSDNNQELTGVSNTENQFTHRYHIFGIYTDYRITLGKITARAGLRYEFSRLGAEFRKGPGEDFHSNLNDFAPNVSFAWNASNSSMWKVSYNRRIRRPGISYLNPAVTTYPLLVSSGNPNLESVSVDNISLNYGLLKAKINLDITANYGSSNNGIGQVQWTDDKNVTHSTYENLIHQRNFSLSTFFQWAITDKTSWMFNGTFFWYKYGIDTEKGNISLAKPNCNIYTRISQKLPWDLNLSGSVYWFSGMVVNPYTYYDGKTENFGYTIQLKRSFLPGKTLDVSLTLSNPGLNSRHGYVYTANNGTTSTQETWRYRSTSVQIGVSWRFGSLKARVKKAANTISNDDLDGRKMGN